MNPTLLAQNAYAPRVAPIRTPKGVEYDAFAKITSAMKTAKTFAEIATALHQNRLLWTILAADVADSKNDLPEELRARIFYLAEFTSTHTSKILRNEAKKETLIEINTAIMRGLRQKVDTQ